ncbi:MAG: tannase/feruloyl esterase family alpha/beta hydrolase [bacterium]
MTMRHVVTGRTRAMSATGARLFRLFVVGSLCGLRMLAVGSAEAASCEELRSLQLPDVRIVSADARESGPFTIREGRGDATLALPAFCRVVAVATPTPDSEIGFEVWLPPADDWNGRLLGVGNGGYTGAIGYPALAEGLRGGYASVGSDTGHTGSDLAFGVGHPEKIADWGHRAVHAMTEAAKPIVRAYQGRFAHHAYFSGCSTGGHQALSEAQRYPDDYDGILAGAPGHNRTRLNAGFLWSWMALHDVDGQLLMPAEKLSALATAVVTSCDAVDGVADGVIDDPRRCRFDPAALRCGGGDEADCLTDTQVEAVRKVYAGARNPRTGARVFTGWSPGSESGWAGYLLRPPVPMRVGYWADWVFGDPHWDWRTFDWDRDLAYAQRRMNMVDATDPDLGAFRRRGGKLLLYAGWADAVVPAGDTIAYYEAVQRASGGPDATSTLARLFTVPGMGHCGGGPGPSTFDALDALTRWVESGAAPDRLIASKVVDGVVERTRPLCPYPRVARYTGEGSTDDAENFRCVVPAE